MHTALIRFAFSYTYFPVTLKTPLSGYITVFISSFKYGPTLEATKVLFDEKCLFQVSPAFLGIRQ